MKAIFKREELAKALTVAAAVAPLKGARPNLRDALLNLQADGVCEVQATDTEVGVRYQFEAAGFNSEDVFAVCLPAGMLAGLLKECTDETVTLEVAPSQTAGTIRAGRDVFEIACRTADDFPEVPGEGSGEAFTLPAAKLARALELTLFAAAREQGRYAINGVHLRVKCGGAAPNSLDVVTTDGRRLAVCKLSVESLPAPFTDPEQSVIIPLKLAQEVNRMCDAAGKDAVVKLALNGRTLTATVANVTLSGLLVQGVFPKYETVVPKDGDKNILFKREAMLRALSKASYLESDETHAVRFEFTPAGTVPGACQIKCNAADKGGAELSLDVDYAGEQTGIQFNSRYLSEALKVLDAESVTLVMKDATRPGVLRSGGGAAPEFTYVIMPMNPKD